MTVTLVGAGPGCLAAASFLRTRPALFSVTMIEKGRPPVARHCPVDAGRRCRACGGTCNVISGFGGAMHYGDSIKLSKFPAGRRLRQHLGIEIYERLERQAQAFFG